ncbi:MAG: adenylate kinase [Acidimicrobiales bacterium]
MIPGARLIVLGKQGAGKGTQSEAVSHHYAIPHISTGDMLRAAVKTASPLGRQVEAAMERGELISDDIVLEMVAQRLKEDDTQNRGFVFDGFPRTVIQADRLDKLLAPLELDLVINLVVPTSLVLKRLAGRRACEVCGTNYSLTSLPRTDWICDVCGGEVVQREDDTEEAIRVRLDLYDKETAPLIARYRRLGKLVSVQGTGTPDDVTSRLISLIDARLGGDLEARP